MLILLDSDMEMLSMACGEKASHQVCIDMGVGKIIDTHGCKRRFGANNAAARAQAVAGSATDRMRESFAAMKNLNLGFTRKSEGM